MGLIQPKMDKAINFLVRHILSEISLNSESVFYCEYQYLSQNISANMFKGSVSFMKAFHSFNMSASKL